MDIAVEAGIRIEEVRQSGGLLKRRRAFRQPLRLRYSFDLRPCRTDCRCLGAVLDEKESLITKDKTGIAVDPRFFCTGGKPQRIRKLQMAHPKEIRTGHPHGVWHVRL